MIFKAVATREAEGALLAGAIPLRGGLLLEAGTCLNADDVQALLQAGIVEVVTAELGAQEISASEAARVLIKKIVPDAGEARVEWRENGAGQISIYAKTTGVLALDEARLTGLNMCDSNLAIATLPAFSGVRAGQKIATLTVLPMALSRAQLSVIENQADESLRIRPVMASAASLIYTHIEALTVGQQARATLKAKLDDLDISIVDELDVAHDTAALVEALLTVGGELAIIVPALPTHDATDTVPAALGEAGGVVTRFGMPVDPGGSFFAGGLGAVPVLGLAQEALRHENSAVYHLIDTLVCGVAVTDETISQMGIGGLLPDEARSRAGNWPLENPQPRWAEGS